MIFFSFTISLHLVSRFMYTQWFLKFGLWNVHKSYISRWKSRYRATNKSMLCVIRATRKPMLIVFRATRKLVLWYLEQQENSCLVFRATRKSMLKVIRTTRKSTPQFQGPFFFWKIEIWAKFPDQTWKNKNTTLINALIVSIFWNKNILCHDTFKR